MPVGFNSAARNLFLLGSSGVNLITNFFKAIDKSTGTDGVYLPDEIRYNVPDQKFILAGSASDSNTKGFGWFEKRNQAGTSDWNVRVEATTSVNTTLRALEIDSNDNLVVVGKTNNIPWIAKYSNGGVIDWQSTTNSGDVEYTDITSDSSGNYYACGNTPVTGQAQAFVEKFDTSGNPGWGKSAFMLGRDVVLNKVAANSRGEVVAVGYLEDDTANKGYIVKINANTGEVLWDRTLSSVEYGSNFLNPLVISKDCICLGVYIDNKDQIYVCGYKANVDSYDVGYIIKYTAEGNMLWQKEMRGDPDADAFVDGVGYRFTDVKADGETEQVVVLSQSSVGLGGADFSLYKFSKDGSVIFRRRVTSNRDGNFTTTANSSLDADPSFYYLLFTDQSTNILNGTPDKYTFGKVSTSGNGLGNFEYISDVNVAIDYTYGANTGDLSIVNGTIFDGSVRNDTSDLSTYPFSANKLLFDDLATQVTNKKRQMDGPDSFEYSGSPAIRVADFQELNLLGDVYSGSGNWLDQSGKGNDGVVNGATWNASGWFVFDRTIESHINLGNVLGTTDPFTLEVWVNPDNLTGSQNILSKGTNFWLHREITTNQYRVKYHDILNVRYEAISTTLAAVGTWAHVVGIWDGSNLKLYVNGFLEGTTSTTATPLTNTLPLAIGDYFTSSSTTADGFSGKIGEVRIYPRALTPAQVFQNYNATREKYTGVPASTDPGLTSTRTPA